MPWVERVLAVARAQESPGRASVIGRADRMSAPLTALVNGTAVHALDYDDDPAACHIGAVVIPVSLALGQALRATPTRVIAAVVLGYDVTTRIGEAIDADLLYQKGYHPTSVCGVFGAAAAAAYLHGLDAATTTQALGIAGSFSSGSMEFLADGPMTKRLQPGKAAHDGILAAELARAGLTGLRTILDGRYGLWRYTESRDDERFMRGLGTRFAVQEVYVKKHASCLGNAPALDGVLDLMQAHRIAPAQIREIRMRPQTMLDAQMSLPYSLAVAMLDGEAGIAQFAPDRLRDPRIIALAERIHVYAHPELATAKAGNLTSYLDLDTTDGRHFAECLETYRGHPKTPMTDEEMETKFRRCASLRISADRVSAASEAMWNLDKLPDLTPLLAAIAG